MVRQEEILLGLGIAGTVGGAIGLFLLVRRVLAERAERSATVQSILSGQAAFLAPGTECEQLRQLFGRLSSMGRFEDAQLVLEEARVKGCEWAQEAATPVGQVAPQIRVNQVFGFW